VEGVGWGVLEEGDASDGGEEMGASRSMRGGIDDGSNGGGGGRDGGMSS